MDLILFDRFNYENYDTAKTYQVTLFYNTELDGQIEVRVVDTADGSEAIPPASLEKSQTNRIYTEFQTIYQGCIGTTGYIFRAVYNLPFATREAVFDAPFCNVEPQPAECNLVVYGLEPTNETATGANDGTVKVNYSTSNNPVQFRVDDGAFGSDNPITGLAPGTHVIETKDSLGCANVQTIQIGRYKQVLVETPARNLSTNNVSRWNAVFNPANFVYQRKDYLVSYVSTVYDAFVVVYIDEVLTDEQKLAFAPEAQIYVKTDRYDFTSESTGSFYNDRAGQTGIAFATNLRGADSIGGYLNVLSEKVGYRFATELTFGFEDVKDTYIARHSPNGKGLTIADVSRYLRPEMRAKDEFLYHVRNWRDENLCCSYTVRYRAEWEGGQDNWQSITEPFYFTFSALQIGNPYGSNMAAYVPFAIEPNPAKKAKFLQEFTKPIFYAGMPFDLAFIYSEQLLGRQLYVRQTALLNGIGISGPLDAFLLNEDSSFLLNEDTSKLLIERGDTAITDLIGVNRLILDNVYPVGTQEVGVYLYYLEGGSEVRVTEILQLQFKQSPDCSEYRYIKWLNPLGGWSYAMFEYRVTHGLDVGERVIISRPIANFATGDTSQDVVSNTAVRKETVGREGVKGEDLKVLSSIFYSVKAYVLVKESPRQWMTIIIEPKSGKLYDTKEGFGDIEFSYRMPDLNLQHQ